jgi:hypothetical protein
MTSQPSDAPAAVARPLGGMHAAAIVFVFTLPALIAWWMPMEAGMPADVAPAASASTTDAGPPAGYLSGALSVDPRDEAQPESF